MRTDRERTKLRFRASVLLVLGLTIVTARPARPAPKPKSTPTPTRTATPVVTATPTPTFTPTPVPTPTKTPPPPPDGLAVTIEYPLDGAVTPWNVSDVSGTVEGPERIGVVVNGETATIGLDANGRRVFFVDDLPLTAGDVTITASALTIEGSEVNHSVRVNAGTIRPPVQMSVSPVAGVSPLAVTFEVEVDDAISYAYPTIDFDADGTADASVTQRKATLSHTYSQTGLHRARLQSQSQKRPIIDDVAVLVGDQTNVGGSLQLLWEEFRTAMRARDVDRALALVVVSSRDRIAPLLTAMIDNGIDADVAFFPVEPGIIRGGLAELTMPRQEPDGTTVGYPVIFVIDTDGIWRIKSF